MLAKREGAAAPVYEVGQDVTDANGFRYVVKALYDNGMYEVEETDPDGYSRTNYIRPEKMAGYGFAPVVAESVPEVTENEFGYPVYADGSIAIDKMDETSVRSMLENIGDATDRKNFLTASLGEALERL